MAKTKRHRIWHVRRRPLRAFNTRVHEALFAADEAAQARDIDAAERWARLADRLSALALRMQRLPPPEPEQNIDELREELRRRFERIVGFRLETREWVRKPDDFADLIPLDDEPTSP